MIVEALSQPIPAPPALEALAQDYVSEYLETSRRFLVWYRANLVAVAPTAEAAAANDRVLPWLIRTARLLHGQLLDPHWPHPELARRLEITLWQLEEAWAQTHNPMTETEADALLGQTFPLHAS
jgi:hypothetical protein